MSSDAGIAERVDHLKLVKERAKAYLKEGNPRGAVLSLMSDFTTSKIYNDNPMIFQILRSALQNLNIVDEKFIDGFI